MSSTDEHPWLLEWKHVDRFPRDEVWVAIFRAIGRNGWYRVEKTGNTTFNYDGTVQVVKPYHAEHSGLDWYNWGSFNAGRRAAERDFVNRFPLIALSLVKETSRCP